MKAIFTLLFSIILSLTIAAQNWTNYNTTNGLACDYVYTIAIDAQGNKWVGTNEGVSKFDDTNWTTYTISNSGLATDRVNTIAIDLQGNKWFGTWGGGVSKFDGINWTTYLPYTIVTCITMDPQGILWFGTSGGVSKYDGTNWVNYTTDNLPSSFIKSIAIEANGIKWVGTNYGGVWKFDGTNWTNYTKANSGLADDCVASIAIDNNGNKWFGTLGGLSKFNDTNMTTYSVPTVNANAIAFDAIGNLWVASTGPIGVLKFDLINWTIYNNPVGISDQFLSIVIDNQGNKWLGTYGNGVLKFEDVLTGITDPKSESQTGKSISAYPNPVIFETILLFPLNDRYTLIITDMNGKIVRKFLEIEGEKMHITSIGMKPGMYFLLLKSLTKGNTYKGKIVVAK